MAVHHHLFRKLRFLSTPARLGLIGILLALGLALSLAPPQIARAATVRYVKPRGVTSGSCDTWANACELRYALAGVAVSGDEIWVAEGAYKPGTSCTATFRLKNGVGLYGGFAGTETSRDQRNWEGHVTTLSGEIGTVGDKSDNSYHVVTGSGTDATAILDGFTITGGNANGDWPDSDGGGMYNENGSPRLTNVTFSGNSAHVLGGGMFNNDSSPTLTEVTFSGNSAWTGGGMGNDWNSSPRLSNVTFSGNSATYGGGMFNDNSSPTLTNVTFSGNSARDGGGMLNCQSSPALTEVTFSGNSATWYGGGMDNYGSSPRLTNVTLSGNSATYGGGMDNYGSSPRLTNVTFSGNSATWYGGGMDNGGHSSPRLTNVTFSGNSATDSGGGMDNGYYSSPTLTNCILWGNTASSGPQIYNDDTSFPSVTYSLVQGAYSGNGNISDNPQFVRDPNPGGDGVWGTDDDDYGDLRLQASSPAIDAGDNDAVPADSADLDGDGDTTEQTPLDLAGNPRFFDHPRPDTGHGTPPIVDMGAYEARILYYSYLPIIIKNYASAPDLVVEEIIAAGRSVQVTIKNEGDEPVNDEFWVDFYVNPHPPPTRVNQTWQYLCAQGIAWGVTASALPLNPGQTLVLTNARDDPYYVPAASNFSRLAPGTPIYAQVDSANDLTDYGAVLENHEITGGEYNNIKGRTSTVAQGQAVQPPARGEAPPAPLGHLPPRP